MIVDDEAEEPAYTMRPFAACTPCTHPPIREKMFSIIAALMSPCGQDQLALVHLLI